MIGVFGNSGQFFSRQQIASLVGLHRLYFSTWLLLLSELFDSKALPVEQVSWPVEAVVG